MKQHPKKTRSVKLSIGTELVVEIQGMGSFGEGITSVEGCDIFVPKTATKDVVRIKMIEQKKGRYRAQLLELLAPSPLRRSARCQHFQECGGCDFQHLPYEEQMAWKVRQTKHWIRRSPLAPYLPQIEFDDLRSPQEWAYRHRVRLQVKDHRLHFFKPHSHELLPLKECPILSDGFFDQLQKDAETLSDTRDWNQSQIDSYEIDGCCIRFDSACFTQANLDVNRLIWNRIYEDIHELPSKRAALDLFCGIGNFSLPLKKYFSHVTGIESFGPSLQWARRNSNEIEWLEGDCSQVLQRLDPRKHFFDFVLLDPPRAGALDVCRLIGSRRVPHITYVSCNLESLIVDLTHLCKKQSYCIKRWSVADMFPQTHHIESVVSLVPK